ncbi:hypothetical protein ACX3T3_03910 [Actinotignum schaalii]|uniref:hypothetical protein n=1 Tax=Actinotignum TaxID=1653174 RepID=UPI00237E2857|nr:hypothetical protein [Actinotignum sanguinis]MDE1552240.1 hypothetical protein [Actinotignum sanguinis]
MRYLETLMRELELTPEIIAYNTGRPVEDIENVINPGDDTVRINDTYTAVTRYIGNVKRLSTTINDVSTVLESCQRLQEFVDNGLSAGAFGDPSEEEEIHDRRDIFRVQTKAFIHNLYAVALNQVVEALRITETDLSYMPKPDPKHAETEGEENNG